MPIKDTYTVAIEKQVNWFTAAGASAGDYDCRLFLADDAYEVVWAGEMHQTAGSSTTASVDILKVTAAQARASGVSVLASVFDLSQAANTIQTRTGSTLTATAANRKLAAGDSLAANNAGTLTAVDAVALQVILRKI